MLINKQDKLYKCDDCGAVCTEPQVVEYKGLTFREDHHYCAKCRKPYTKEVYKDGGPNEYYKEFHVHADGTPVGYVSRAEHNETNNEWAHRCAGIGIITFLIGFGTAFLL